MNVCLSDVKRMDDSAQAADSMKLVSIVICVLLCAKAKGRSRFVVGLAKFTT